MSTPQPSRDASRAATQLGRVLGRALDEAVLSPAGYRLMGYLASGGAAATMLAEKLAVSRPAVTSTVDWLESRGLVTRAPDPEDGRRISISITSEGARALKDADQRVQARLHDVLTHLADDDDAVAVIAALERVLVALNLFRESKHEAALKGAS